MIALSKVIALMSIHRLFSGSYLTMCLLGTSWVAAPPRTSFVR
jgi:hypothetical protein